MIKNDTYGFHGESQIFVRNNSRPKAERPLSDINKACLTKRANEIAAKLMNGGNAPEEKGYFSKLIGHYSDKGATQIGYFAGNAATQTYGQGVVNKAVDYVSKKVLGNSALVSSALQMAVTPLVLPYLTAFSAAAGGIALPAAIGLVGALYNRLLATGKFTLETLPPPDQLIRYDGDKRAFFDALGEELDDQELIDLQLMIQEFDLISKILASNKDDVGSVLFNAVNFDSKDFNKLSRNEKRALQTEIDEMKLRLQGNNRYKQSEGVLPALEKLVKYSIRPINATRVENEQTLHSINKEMDAILNKIKISTESSLYFDDATKSFYVPSNRVSSWWYYQTPETIAGKVSKFLEPELLEHCDKILEMRGNMTEISKEEMGVLGEKLDNIAVSFDSLNKKFAELNNDTLNRTADDLHVNVIQRLVQAENGLKSKLN